MSKEYKYRHLMIEVIVDTSDPGGAIDQAMSWLEDNSDNISFELTDPNTGKTTYHNSGEELEKTVGSGHYII